MRYETAIRFLRLLKEHETFPAAACVARFWAQPPKYMYVYKHTVYTVRKREGKREGERKRERERERTEREREKRARKRR